MNHAPEASVKDAPELRDAQTDYLFAPVHFCIVPNWILEAACTGRIRYQDLALYCILRRLAENGRGETRATRERLAGWLGLSASEVNRGKVALASIGAIATNVDEVSGRSRVKVFAAPHGSEVLPEGVSAVTPPRKRDTRTASADTHTDQPRHPPVSDVTPPAIHKKYEQTLRTVTYKQANGDLVEGLPEELEARIKVTAASWRAHASNFVRMTRPMTLQYYEDALRALVIQNPELQEPQTMERLLKVIVEHKDWYRFAAVPVLTRAATETFLQLVRGPV